MYMRGDAGVKIQYKDNKKQVSDMRQAQFRRKWRLLLSWIASSDTVIRNHTAIPLYAWLVSSSFLSFVVRTQTIASFQANCL